MSIPNKTLDVPVVSDSVIQTYSGHYLDLLNPNPDHILLEDIAHALSMICRFTGHSSDFYSVAQHCVLCCHNAPHGFEWHALMHDSHEAYIGDMSRPLKNQLPHYKIIEKNIENIVFNKFKINISDEIRTLDMQALLTERRDLMIYTDEIWEPTIGYEPWDQVITPWNPAEAKHRFLSAASAYNPN